jgi:hypothetical protein
MTYSRSATGTPGVNTRGSALGLWSRWQRVGRARRAHHEHQCQLRREKKMMRHIIAGLLTLFVMAQAVEVFSADLDPLMTPEQQEELGVEAPSYVLEFPFAPSSVGGLTFTLYVTNRNPASLSIVVTTVPSGQTPIQRPLNLGASQIAGFDPGILNCATGNVCRLVVSFQGGTNTAFDALLQIQTTAGQPIGFVPATLGGPVQ